MRIQYRNFRWDDAVHVVDLFNLSLQADGEAPHMTETQLKHLYDTSAHHLEHSFLAWDRNKLVGCSLLRFGGIKGVAQGAIHPDYRRKGIGARLIDLSDNAVRTFAEENTSPNKPVYLLRDTLAENIATIALFGKMGYQAERHFYAMVLELQDTIVIPKFPAEFILKPFVPDTHIKALHTAFNQSFKDAWGFRDGVSLNTFKMNIMHADLDYSLWHVLWRNESVVGYSLTVTGPGDLHQGRVRLLGILPAMRRKGLGMMLLKHSFRVFQERGYPRVMLNVDTAGDTNPLKLYQRAGMTVNEHKIIFRCILRGAAANIHD